LSDDHNHHLPAAQWMVVAMTHCTTVSQAKGDCRSHGHRAKPKEGSTLRSLYDTFQSNPGVALHSGTLWHTLAIKHGNSSTMLEQLRSTYGLDIRHVMLKDGLPNPMSTCGRHSRAALMLVGEWDGRDYIDYMVRGDGI